MNARADFEGLYPRQLPMAVEAEASLLGALLLNNSAWDVVGDLVTAEDFYAEHHRIVFAAISALIVANKSADVVTVWEHIKATGKADQVGLAEVNELAQFMPSLANLRRYAEIVRDASLSRRLVQIGGEIAELGFDAEQGFEDRLSTASAKLAGLEQAEPKEEWVSAIDGMVAHLDVMQDRYDGTSSGWPTGLTDLDEVLDGGLMPGALYVIGARPSMGKTALGMSIGLHMARHRAVGMLSMEMPHRDLNDRITAMLSHVSLSSVKRPEKGLQWDRITDGCESAKLLKWYASDQSNLTINQVRIKARQLKRRHGLSVLIVDYIGLMNGTDPRQPRAYQLEEISRGLKSLAKEIEIAVLCLAQLNRAVEDRTDQTPKLSDLRDSGAIEQDADSVMFIHRPAQSNPNLTGEWEQYAKLSVAKNRQGRSGVVVNLRYEGHKTLFTDWQGPAPVVRTVTNSSKGMRDE